MRRILSSSVHQVHARVQAAGGVDEDDVALARLARGDGVEDDGRGIGARLRADEVDAGPLRPDLELLDGRGAERVGGADQRRPASILDQARQLADRGRLAGAVDADDQRRRAAGVRWQPACRRRAGSRGSRPSPGRAATRRARARSRRRSTI